MRLMVVLSLVLFALAGCNPAPRSADGGGDGPAASSQQPILSVAPEYNLGDVETSFKLTTRLSEKSDMQSVQYNEVETRKYELAQAQALVSKPYPEHLIIESVANLMTGLRANDAIVTILKIYLTGDEERLAASGRRIWTSSDVRNNNQIVDVDILEHLDTIPESLLVHARLEIIWLPDTDPATVDPEGDFTSATHRIEILSNPVRFEFR